MASSLTERPEGGWLFGIPHKPGSPEFEEAIHKGKELAAMDETDLD